ncbi:MAG: NnrU family protein, partial [Myxococcota bacterium]|nr:NnrU family protein [Myxococcota bacterium]
MRETVWIVLLWIGFTATHLGLASRRVEPALERRLGRAAFLGLYSLVAFALFVPLVWIYFDHRHAGPWLWFVPVGPGLRIVLYAVMTFG